MVAHNSNVVRQVHIVWDSSNYTFYYIRRVYIMGKKKNKKYTIPSDLTEIQMSLIESLTDGALRMRALNVMLSSSEEEVEINDIRTNHINKMIELIDSKIIELVEANTVEELDRIVNLNTAQDIINQLGRMN